MSAAVTQLRSRRAKRPPLRLVRRRSRNLIKRTEGRRYMPVAMAGVICVLAVVFGVLLEQVVLAQSAFRLARIQEGLVAAEEHHEELLLEVATLENPERIERFARHTLGMVEADPGRVEYIVADVRGRGRSPAASLRRAGIAADGTVSTTEAEAFGSSP
jgi:cell division protein FtsL